MTEVFLIITEVFPCFFLGCKANTRVKLAKTGHGPHSSTLVVICVVRLFNAQLDGYPLSDVYDYSFNLLAPEFHIQILAQPVCKM